MQLQLLRLSYMTIYYNVLRILSLVVCLPCSWNQNLYF